MPRRKSPSLFPILLALVLLVFWMAAPYKLPLGVILWAFVAFVGLAIVIEWGREWWGRRHR
jgi:hypothetical protein